MRTYIIESAKRAQDSVTSRSLFGRIHVIIANPLGDGISLKSVLAAIEKRIPPAILNDVEVIYIGDFEPLRTRNVESMFVGGSILISNKIESERALFNALVHEFAHAVEEYATEFIYKDGDIGREFLGKRKTLFSMLKDDYQVERKDFLNINYDPKLDIFFSEELGYDNMRPLTYGLFLSPYAATSLREYFANAFENIFTEGDDEVRKLCPIAYKKIHALLKHK